MSQKLIAPIAILFTTVNAGIAHAQFQPITAITTTNINTGATAATATGVGASNGNYNLSFAGNRLALSSLTAGGTLFNSVSGISSSVSVRRSSLAAPERNAWYTLTADTGTSINTGSNPRTASFRSNFDGSTNATLDSLLGSNNLYAGLDNLWANSDGSGNGNFSNVERIDVVFAGGLSASSRLGFNILERHATGAAHEGFRIAAITSVGTVTVGGTPFTNAPTAWGNIQTSTDANYGQDVLTTNYAIVRDTAAAGDAQNQISVTGNQQLGGVFVPSSFLAAQGTTIFGFSIFAADMVTTNFTPGTSATYQDWTNASLYPTNSGAGGDLGIDPVATMGTAFIAVPEPASCLLLLTGGLFLVRRRKK